MEFSGTFLHVSEKHVVRTTYFQNTAKIELTMSY